MSILRLDGVRREIGDFVILDSVTAALSRGERVGLVGGNGAGKTTLLEIVAGRMARNWRLLCLDEFHVVDIGDAVILAGLLKALFDQGMVLRALGLGDVVQVLVDFLFLDPQQLGQLPGAAFFFLEQSNDLLPNRFHVNR